MPDPERLLRTLRLARTQTLATPGRRGRIVELDGAREVLIAGDLHGHLGHFQQLFKLANLGQNPDRHLVLQEMIHGPFHYPEGGDRSHQMVDLYAAMKCQFPKQVHYLMGNHEFAQWIGRKIAKGDSEQNTLFLAGVLHQYGDEMGTLIYDAYRELFAVIPLMVRTPNRVCMTHSLPSASKMASFDPSILAKEVLEPSDLLPSSPIYSLLWGRDASPANATKFLEKVDGDLLITGHIPTQNGYTVPNDRQIIIDCADRPAACCLFPCDRPLTHDELVACIQML